MSKPCQCTAPGFCDRYQLQVGPARFRLCQTREDYREVWDTPTFDLPPEYTPGPGTELHKLLTSLRVDVSAICDCRQRIRRMNAWGVQGCLENKAQIVGWLKKDQDKYDALDKLKAAVMSVTTGLAFKLDLLDPFPSLVDEAIRRAS